ncbi:MAG: sugar ABC transporter ATP-binding protein [Spirochaetales bacterium]|nr:sugar ABC transporter ATP-binding protein [Spirochaetales bacterium]
MDFAVRARNITKTFPGVKALTDVSLDVIAGETHSIVGENGAGKSTLMKVLGGVYIPDSGEFEVCGESARFKHPVDSQRAGISVIYQEFNLMSELSVAENIYANRLPLRFGFVDRKRLISETTELLTLLDLPLDPEIEVGKLSVAEKQMTEIAKAVSLDASVIIMDEPTAALNDAEVVRLFEIIKNLKDQGKTILYISHRMKEIFDVSDRVTVLRDGKLVGTAPLAELDVDKIVRMMVGRDVKAFYRHPGNQIGETVLKVNNLCREPYFRNISFDVKAGEIFGLGGLMGCGIEEICRALYSLDSVDSGILSIEGEEVSLKNTAHAMAAGIAYVTEDRKESGIFPLMGVRDNLTINTLTQISRFGGAFIPPENEQAIFKTYSDLMKMRFSGPEQIIRDLSGGNQQKAVLGRALARSCKVLILLEPTRGIDVGTKGEIYELLDELTNGGLSIILVSSDLPELISLSHRVAVIRDGKIAGVLTGREIEETRIMKIATGAEVGA